MIDSKPQLMYVRSSGWAHTAKLRARVRVEMNRSSWIHVRKRCRCSGGTVVRRHFLKDLVSARG